MMNEACEKILFSKDEIQNKVIEIAQKINEDYKGQEVVILCVLNGAFMFASDLIKHIDLDCEIDFIQCSTYGNSTVSSGEFVMKKDLSRDIRGKNVIICEDILDSGYTMLNLKKHLEIKNPKSLKLATFIDKSARRVVDINPDYYGFTMDKDEFIVGYGLDYAQKYRNLSYVAVLKEEVYN